MNQFYTEDQAEIIQVAEKLLAKAERGTLKRGVFVLTYEDGSKALVTFAEGEPLRITKIKLSG